MKRSSHYIEPLLQAEGSEGSLFERDTIIHDRTNSTSNDYDYRLLLARIRNSTFKNNYLEYLGSDQNGCEYCYLLEDSESSNIESNYFKHQNRNWSNEQGSIADLTSYGNISNDSVHIVNNIFDHFGSDYNNSDKPVIRVLGSNGSVNIHSNTITSKPVNNQSNTLPGQPIIIHKDNSTLSMKNNNINVNTNSDAIVINYIDSCRFEGNNIIQTGEGSLLNSHAASIELYNNNFTRTRGHYYSIRATNSNLDAKYNNITTTGDGIFVGNQSTGKLRNNTIISTGYISNGELTTAQVGIHQEGNTNVPAFNNIIQGYVTGVSVDNTIQNYNLNNNLFWDITDNLFDGTAVPPLAGQLIDENSNGDPSDIYSNIFLDPAFIDYQNANYSLQQNSPAVNAGDPNYVDEDGTVSDIGANYFHIYVVVNHTPLGNTDIVDQPYRVSTVLTSPSGAELSGSLFYRINGGDYAEINLAADDGVTNGYYADIPAQELNTVVDYYLSATDGENNVTYPFNTDNGGFSFFVSLFETFANMGGSQRTTELFPYPGEHRFLFQDPYQD